MSYIKLSKILGFTGGFFIALLGIYVMIWHILFPDPEWISQIGRSGQLFFGFLVSLSFLSLGFLSLTGSFLLKKRPIIGSVLMLIGGIIFIPPWFYLFLNIKRVITGNLTSQEPLLTTIGNFYYLLCSLPFIAGLIVLINRIYSRFIRK